MKKINDFKQDLAWSQSMSVAPWWGTIYKRAFPTIASMVHVNEDGYAQRGGIDRIITLTSGRVIKVDEKIRRRFYNDILLEIRSDAARNKPGWVVKPMECDYLAYAFLPTQNCYLFPMLNMQMAWRNNSANWIREYGIVKAQNKSWVTENCPVPLAILMKAINESMRVSWSEIEKIEKEFPRISVQTASPQYDLF